MTVLPSLARQLGLTALAGGALLGYSLCEARWPVLRQVEVPLLAPGEEPFTILHLSDLHLTDRTEARVAWVRALAEHQPDMVVNTGDNLSFASGLEPLREALTPFLGLPGAFVLGDHDYRSTIFKSPTRYLRRDPRTADTPEKDEQVVALPWEEVRDMQAAHWFNAVNARGSVSLHGRSIAIVGTDDAHVDRDQFPAPSSMTEPDPAAQPGPMAQPGPAADAGPMAEPAAAGAQADTPADAAGSPTAILAFDGRPLSLGLTHSPYLRVLDDMSNDGVHLAFAGHTHGGQLCLPGYGALVTNCDLDRSRASGLSRYPGSLDDPLDAGDMFLHVSAGLGTSPYTPVRLACRPEATLLHLIPA